MQEEKLLLNNVSGDFSQINDFLLSSLLDTNAFDKEMTKEVASIEIKIVQKPLKIKL